jgi:hypothetical protein
VPAVTGRLPYGSLAVAAGTSIRVFAASARGNAAPIRVIKGAKTTLSDAYSVKFDPSGNLWVADIMAQDVVEFAARARGNVAPIRRITAAPPILNDPIGLAVTPDGKGVWVGNDNSTTLAEFSTSPHGGNVPVRTIAGSKTGISWSHDLAVSANGLDLWEADGRPTTMREFRTSGPTNRAPVRVLSEPAAAGHYYFGVAIDRTGDVWTSDFETGALIEWGPHSATRPARLIVGTRSALSDPASVGLDAVDRLWAPSQDAKLERFSTSVTGDAAPQVRITGPATGLPQGYTNGVTVFTASPGSPRAVHTTATRHKIQLSWRAPAVTGGGLLGFTVLRRTTKRGAPTVIATTLARSWADTKARRHHQYFYSVKALNELGSSAPSRKVAASLKT